MEVVSILITVLSRVTESSLFLGVCHLSSFIFGTQR